MGLGNYLERLTPWIDYLNDREYRVAAHLALRAFEDDGDPHVYTFGYRELAEHAGIRMEPRPSALEGLTEAEAQKRREAVRRAGTEAIRRTVATLEDMGLAIRGNDESKGGDSKADPGKHQSIAVTLDPFTTYIVDRDESGRPVMETRTETTTDSDGRKRTSTRKVPVYPPVMETRTRTYTDREGREHTITRKVPAWRPVPREDPRRWLLPRDERVKGIYRREKPLDPSHASVGGDPPTPDQEGPSHASVGRPLPRQRRTAPPTPDQDLENLQELPESESEMERSFITSQRNYRGPVDNSAEMNDDASPSRDKPEPVQTTELRAWAEANGWPMDATA
ncbi:hypothetical protein [Micrococcus luteus]|uniref:hypothetical protein n=1 Tax=Micrococcus luteus TaxID=1270 RepID=UPI0036B3DFC9